MTKHPTTSTAFASSPDGVATVAKPHAPPGAVPSADTAPTTSVITTAPGSTASNPCLHSTTTEANHRTSLGFPSDWCGNIHCACTR